MQQQQQQEQWQQGEAEADTEERYVLQDDDAETAALAERFYGDR